MGPEIDDGLIVAVEDLTGKKAVDTDKGKARFVTLRGICWNSGRSLGCLAFRSPSSCKVREIFGSTSA